MSRSVDMIISQALGPGIHTEDGNPVPIPYRPVQTPRLENGVEPTTPTGAQPTGIVGNKPPFPR